MKGLPRGQRWAVLSDIHSNAAAFDAALRQCATVDRVIVMGDLLTYGAAPARVMESLFELRARMPGELLLGNHDQIYLDLLAGRTEYYDRLPDWIRESVDWTLERLDPSWLDVKRGWAEHAKHGEILFSHANPFVYGDWRYLNTLEDHAHAMRALQAAGFKLGVFGHTHRAKWFTRGALHALAGEIEIDGETLAHGVIANPGAVGQPRDESKTATFALLSWPDSCLRVESCHVVYDVDAHMAEVRSSGMRDTTIERLCSFFS